MTQTIPVRKDLQFHLLRVDNLSGAIFRFNFKFSARDGLWYFDILTDDNQPIRSGVRVVEGMPLLRNVAQLVRPNGELVPIDTVGLDRDPDLETFGSEVVLAYEPAA